MESRRVSWEDRLAKTENELAELQLVIERLRREKERLSGSCENPLLVQFIPIP